MRSLAGTTQKAGEPFRTSIEDTERFKSFIYTDQFIAGLGIGLTTVVGPVYHIEIV
jgi:hypothetical protein